MQGGCISQIYGYMRMLNDGNAGLHLSAEVECIHCKQWKQCYVRGLPLLFIYAQPSRKECMGYGGCMNSESYKKSELYKKMYEF